MKKLTFEQFLENKHKARLKREDKWLEKREKQELAVDPMVGELASGKFYCFPVGGKYFESISRYKVVDYLIRNGYCR
jgi:hypothetical protein